MVSGAAVERAAGDERVRWELGDEEILRGRDEPTRLAFPAGAVAPVAPVAD